MFPMNTLDARLRELLDQLDALAEERGDEDLEELNAEFEDALFMLGEIDLKAGDWRDEILDALEELDALRQDYAAREDTAALSEQMNGLLAMARSACAPED